MPLRQKLKKVFSRSDDDSLSRSETSSTRKNSNVYQPGEAIPAPKYRGRVDPKHKAHLESFSFGSSDWRRRSTNSVYSPMGSKMPSRNSSVNHLHMHYKDSACFGELQAASTIDSDGNTTDSDIEKGIAEHIEYVKQRQ